MDGIGLMIIIPIAAAAVFGAGFCGIVAIVSPRTFETMATFACRKFDTKRCLAWLDREVNIDKYVFQHARLFGLLTIAAILLLAWVLILPA